MLLSKEDLKEQLAGLMGGRVAEEIVLMLKHQVRQMTLSKLLR